MTAPVCFFSYSFWRPLPSLLPGNYASFAPAPWRNSGLILLLALSLRYFLLGAIPDVHNHVRATACRIALPYPADNGQIMGKVPR
jgi:hypothetical protein